MNPSSGYGEEYFRARDVVIQPLAMVVRDLLLRLGKPKSLDVGAGSGWLKRYLASEGIDLTATDAYADSQRWPEVVKADARALPFPDGSFEVVIGISLLEHLRDQDADRFLAEARRVLTARGKLFLVTPNAWSPNRLLKGRRWFGYSDPTHVQFFTLPCLKTLLGQHGFEIRVTRFPVPQDLREINWPLPWGNARSTWLVNLTNWFFLQGPGGNWRDSLWVLGERV